MKIIIGKLVGGSAKSGTSSKTGLPYNIVKIAIATAQKNCFESMPEIISIPPDKLPISYPKLQSMPIGSDISVAIETQQRTDQADVNLFIDWFTLPNSAGAAR